MIPAPFDYEVAGSVDEAVALLESREDSKLLAGGPSLLPLLRLRLTPPPPLVYIGPARCPPYLPSLVSGSTVGFRSSTPNSLE